MSKTKAQVFALAKKHGVTINGDVDRYWGEAQCEWDAPEGYRFTDTDNHYRYFECPVGPDVPRNDGAKNAPMFWTLMYEELEANVNSLEKCTEPTCDYCGRYDE